MCTYIYIYMFINKTNLTKQQQQQRTKTYHSYVLPHPFSQNPTKDTKSVLATIQNGFILIILPWQLPVTIISKPIGDIV